MYLLLIISPVLAINWLTIKDLSALFVNLGKAAGLIAFVILVIQAVLTTRLKILDRIFAIDKLTNFHKSMGIVIIILLIIHVSLLIAGFKNPAMLSAHTSWEINLGKTAIGLAFITVTLAATFQAFGIDYNIWRLSHKTALAIIALAFLHSYFIGPELHSQQMKILWWILILVGFSAAIYRNLYIPFFLRKSYIVNSVIPQTYNTYTISLSPEDGEICPYKPGQFIFLKLKRPGRKSEIHPFTLSSSPAQTGILQVTIKKSGNFTNTIDQTIAGDKALIEGPYGQFSFLNIHLNTLFFIAGGVGITPFMSMIKYLRDTGDSRKVTILYANRTQKDIIFNNELETLPQNIKVVHILSNPDHSWTGLKGYITKDTIYNYANDFLQNCEVFLCGPPPMMKKMLTFLKELNIPASRIHYERFSI